MAKAVIAAGATPFPPRVGPGIFDSHDGLDHGVFGFCSQPAESPSTYL